MSYQYLFCATCGLRRMGHGMRCTVCNSLLRRPHTARPVRPGLPVSFESLRRTWQDLPEPELASRPDHQPIAA